MIWVSDKNLVDTRSFFDNGVVYIYELNETYIYRCIKKEKTIFRASKSLSVIYDTIKNFQKINADYLPF